MHKAIYGSATALLLMTLTGCRQDMQNQPKMYPQRSTTFFADGRSVRSQVSGTVARSQGDQGSYFLTGMIDGKESDGMPFPVTIELISRGQERYNIFCSPCHSRVGNGLGMVVQRGYYLADDFHKERLRQAPLGHLFKVITEGYGSMPSYGAEVPPQDRWAITAYIRALQLSQNAKLTDVKRGEKVRSLEEVATQAGLPASFADRWGVAASTPPAVTELTKGAASGSPSSTIQRPVDLPPALAQRRNDLPNSGRGELPTDNVKSTARKTHQADLAAGQRVYVQHCQICHQETRSGIPPNIPSLIGITDRVGAEHIRSVITDGIPAGKPPMPASPGLSADDLDNLIAFLHSSK
jgi:mono/diheme cytochrome c family protein